MPFCSVAQSHSAVFLDASQQWSQARVIRTTTIVRSCCCSPIHGLAGAAKAFNFTISPIMVSFQANVATSINLVDIGIPIVRQYRSFRKVTAWLFKPVPVQG